MAFLCSHDYSFCVAMIIVSVLFFFRSACFSYSYEFLWSFSLSLALSNCPTTQCLIVGHVSLLSLSRIESFSFHFTPIHTHLCCRIFHSFFFTVKQVVYQRPSCSLGTVRQNDQLHVKFANVRLPLDLFMSSQSMLDFH